MVSNKRKLIKCDDIKVLQVPYFEGLSIEEMLDLARDYNGGLAMVALPESQKEINHFPRSYLCNILYTMIGDPFAKWVDRQIVARNKRVKEDKDMAIDMDADIAKLFRESTAVSGKSIIFES